MKKLLALSSHSFAMADLILKSNVENFEEIYKQNQSFVHVKIRFRLIQRKGVVSAFNKAVEKVIVDLNGWLHAK